MQRRGDMSEIQSWEFEGLAGHTRPGPGPRVLWLHGYTLDATSWRPMWDLLPDFHHVGVDLPGHGGSRPLADDETLQTLGQKLHRLCAAEQLHHLAAVSYGTITAIQTAIERPDWFRSITLGAPAMAGGPRDPGMEQAFMRLFQLTMMRRPPSAIRDAWLASPAWQGVDRHPALKAQLIPIVERHPWHELRDFRMSLRMTSPPQSLDALRAVQSPLLVLIGEHEMPAYRQTAEQLEETVPHGSVVELPGVGHLCLLEDPERCAERLAAHVRQHDLPLPREAAP
ncbi:MAG: alpha/beta fold hydrolase [Pirellulaceae bacterium]